MSQCIESAYFERKIRRIDSDRLRKSTTTMAANLIYGACRASDFSSKASVVGVRGNREPRQSLPRIVCSDNERKNPASAVGSLKTRGSFVQDDFINDRVH